LDLDLPVAHGAWPTKPRPTSKAQRWPCQGHSWANSRQRCPGSRNAPNAPPWARQAAAKMAGANCLRARHLDLHFSGQGWPAVCRRQVAHRRVVEALRPVVHVARAWLGGHLPFSALPEVGPAQRAHYAEELLTLRPLGRVWFLWPVQLPPSLMIGTLPPREANSGPQPCQKRACGASAGCARLVSCPTTLEALARRAHATQA